MTASTENTITECDCKVAGISYNVNHRGEFMNLDRRRSRSFGPRCRGLGEVHSLRSSCHDVRLLPAESLSFVEDTHDKTMDLLTDSFEQFPIARQHDVKKGLINDANWLTHDFDTIDNLRATPADENLMSQRGEVRRSSSDLTSHRLPILRDPVMSPSSNYLYYTRQSQPNLSLVGVSDCRYPPDIPSYGPETCPNCVKMSVKLQALTRECDMLRISNNSLRKQLKSSKKCNASMESSDELKNLRATADEEIAALNEEISSLQKLLQESGDSWHRNEAEKTAIDSIRSAVYDHLQSKKHNSPQVEKYKVLIAELQDALMKERDRNYDMISVTESRLVEENARLLASITEQEHTQNLADARITQKQAMNYQLQHKITELKSELGQIDDLLPKLTREEKTILITNWSDIPNSLKQTLKSGSSIAENIGEQESITTPEELIQCLWYRYRFSAQALTELQSELENVGIKKEDQLETLKEIDLFLIQKDEKIKALYEEVETERKSKVEVVKQYADQIKKLTSAKNNWEEKVLELEHKLKCEIISNDEVVTPPENLDDDMLERALTELSTAYDIAKVKEGFLELQKENEKLKIELENISEAKEIVESEFEILRKSNINTSDNDENIHNLRLYEAVDELTASIEPFENHENETESRIKHPSGSSNSQIQNRLTLHSNNDIRIKKLHGLVKKLTLELDDNRSKLLAETKARMESEAKMEKEIGIKETKQHLEHLKEELSQANIDRKELRIQVTEFTRQLVEISATHSHIQNEKDQELADLRREFQDAKHEVEDTKSQLEREKRNAADLKVTYHKEIKNQTITAKRDLDQQIDMLRKELLLAQKTVQSSENEKNRLLDETKVLLRKFKASEKALLNAKKSCESLLKSSGNGSDGECFKDTSQFIRALDEVQKVLKGDHSSDYQETTWLYDRSTDDNRNGGVTSSFIDSRSNVSDEAFNHESIEISSGQLQTCSNQTKEISDNMMGRIRALESYTLIDSAGLKQCLIDLNSKFNLERSLLKNLLNKSLVDLKSCKSRIDALEETKKTLKATYDAFENKVEKLQTEIINLKRAIEEKNQMIVEFDSLQEKYNTMSHSFKDLRKKHKLANDNFLEKTKSSEQVINEMKSQMEQLTERTENLKESLSHSEKENSQLKTVVANEQTSKNNERVQFEQKLSTVQDSFAEVKKELKLKKKELTECQDNLNTLTSEQKKVSTELRHLEEKYRTEQEKSIRLSTKNASLEEEVTSSKHLLSSNQSDKEILTQLQTQLHDLREQLAQCKADLLTREQEMRLKEQQIEWQKQHATEVESQLTRERSLHVASRSRVEALEDEAEWLRTQLSASKKHLGGGGGGAEEASSAGKSRADQINEIILRSQSKAQAMLAKNSDSNSMQMFSSPGGPGSELDGSVR